MRGRRCARPSRHSRKHKRERSTPSSTSASLRCPAGRSRRQQTHRAWARTEPPMDKVLVTGAAGQIGSELIPALREKYGADRVIASDIRMPASITTAEGPFEHLDCTKPDQVHEVVRRHDIRTIYHLAAMLSAIAEDRPQAAWTLNMSGLYHVLEVARQYRCSVFFPSSIGAFGPTTPRDRTPQDTAQRPTTMYGVTKVSGELLCDYYAHRFGVDV